MSDQSRRDQQAPLETSDILIARGGSLRLDALAPHQGHFLQKHVARSQLASRGIFSHGIYGPFRKVLVVRSAFLLISLIVAGCSGEIGSKTKAVDLCDLRVIESLAVPDSYDGAMWQVSEEDDFVTVIRPFNSKNRLGMILEGQYTCAVRDAGEKIAFLRVRGPGGNEIIVDDGTAPNSPKRIGAIEAGAERIAGIDPQNLASSSGNGEEREWLANLSFSGCPEASDWFRMQDSLRAGDYNAELPSRCFIINPGDRILANGHSERETVTYKGHNYERARMKDGRPFWSDSLDDISISPIN